MNDITRRTMLRGLMGTTIIGSTGCAGIPFFGSPRKDDTLVAILSDCHVGDCNDPYYAQRKAMPSHQWKYFTKCISRILAQDPLPSKILITGDLAYLWGRTSDYKLSRELLKPVMDAGIEVTITMGNHDNRQRFLEVWPEYVGRSPVPNRIVSVVKGKYFDYILADSLTQSPDSNKWIVSGELDDAQREWLGNYCREAKRPFFVMAHHPANELGKGNKSCEKCARDFGNLICGPRDQPTKCVGYIHGHDHEWYFRRSLISWQENRVRNMVCLPSTGHWGDIGYVLLKEESTKATLSLVQYDYFRKPLNEGDAPQPAWDAVVRDHQGAQCTFVL